MRCGQQTPAARAHYDDAGALVCASCRAQGIVTATRASMAEDDSRVVGGLFPGAAGALLIGLISFCIQLRFAFFILPLIAVVGGISTALTAIRRPGARDALGWRYVPTLLLGSLAVVVGVSSLVVAIRMRLP
jgi:hypothetical protein